MSTPSDGMLVRANVFVFGTAYVPGEPNGLQEWHLEYGPGRDPKEWIRIKESTTPIDYDPWAAGKVVFNPDWGANGNLSNWTTGLASYQYAREWRTNLNGIYTLRLVAVSRDGKTSEIRRTVIVGEVVMRTQIGTAQSADNKCRLALYPFSFDGFMSRVVAIVKQMPPAKFATVKPLQETEEYTTQAQAMYSKVPGELQLVSPIYRIYPNGLYFDPAANLQLDYDPKSFVVASRQASNDVSNTLIYYWNPVSESWVALETEWQGSTASAKINRLPEYETYVTLLKRVAGIAKSRINWKPRTALTGVWIGRTEAFAKIIVYAGSVQKAEGISDENGQFSISYVLEPGNGSYRVDILPRGGGEAYKVTQSLNQPSGTVVQAPAAKLEVSGDAVIQEGKRPILLCEDSTLARSGVAERRSILAQVQNKSLTRNFQLEFIESIPGSGKFAATVEPGNPQDTFGSYFKNLPDGESVTVKIGSSVLELQSKDVIPPVLAALTSTTHPCLLYASPQIGSATGLIGSSYHSSPQIEIRDNAWKIGGIKGKASARITYWEAPSFSVESWPLIGFSYRLYASAPWQLMLSSEGKINAFTYGEQKSWFKDFAPSYALKADGKWHRWQQTLAAGPFKQINRMFFGSWVKGAFLVADTGFHNPSGESIFIKNLWIGKSYNERQVEMRWKIQDASSPVTGEWWVDQLAEPDVSPSGDTIPEALHRKIQVKVGEEDRCQFMLPVDGQWFFHLQATDAAGNKSAIASFPINIYSTQSRAFAEAQRIVSPPVSQEVAWKQPEGSFTVKLTGLAQSLDSKTMFLELNQTRYGMKNAVWDSDTETLTIDQRSFDKTVPLGFDGEVLTASLGGNDFSNKPIYNFPTVKIKIESPFRFEKTPSGGTHITLRSTMEYGRWRVYWNRPIPPWQELFPGEMNNSLILFSPDLDSKVKVNQVYWERPMISENFTLRYWLEGMDDFNAKELEADVLPEGVVAFDCQGKQINETSQASGSAKSWIYVQAGNDPFEEKMVRVVMLKSRKDLHMRRIPLSDLGAILNSQLEDEIIRIDGWLPPRDGLITLTAPGARKVEYVATGMSGFRTASDNAVRLAGDDGWTHFCILITPQRKYAKTGGVTIRGNVYW